MRSFDPTPPFPIELPVLGGKEVEQQAIVGTAVDVVALTLPADEAEAEALYVVRSDGFRSTDHVLTA
jgi:hypothetical protein